MITPYHLDVPQTDLDDLAARLDATRWPDELPDAARDYGLPLAEVRALAEHWRNGYDWRRQEAELNSFPQFTTEIDGTTIHFVHVRSANPDALPLVRQSQAVNDAIVVAAPPAYRVVMSDTPPVAGGAIVPREASQRLQL